MIFNQFKKKNIDNSLLTNSQKFIYEDHILKCIDYQYHISIGNLRNFFENNITSIDYTISIIYKSPNNFKIPNYNYLPLNTFINNIIYKYYKGKYKDKYEYRYSKYIFNSITYNKFHFYPLIINNFMGFLILLFFLPSIFLDQFFENHNQNFRLFIQEDEAVYQKFIYNFYNSFLIIMPTNNGVPNYKEYIKELILFKNLKKVIFWTNLLILNYLEQYFIKVLNYILNFK